jgi:hypothetical protein
VHLPALGFRSAGRKGTLAAPMKLDHIRVLLLLGLIILLGAALRICHLVYFHFGTMRRVFSLAVMSNPPPLDARRARIA